MSTGNSPWAAKGGRGASRAKHVSPARFRARRWAVGTTALLLWLDAEWSLAGWSTGAALILFVLVASSVLTLVVRTLVSPDWFSVRQHDKTMAALRPINHPTKELAA